MSLTFNIACNSGTQISAVTLRIVREHIVLYYIYIYIYIGQFIFCLDFPVLILVFLTCGKRITLSKNQVVVCLSN